ncbi:uncharacterized protein Triagg1_8878 [Trichoderma aggressivum f. europaeum]|uniref:Uncharacterized protein n=1 Tax=Trichoderma aggressivum f. europaeum TaxID=173218 RepID=A0AAE1LWU9_9HYPO|nr:hypothetical protein Triagg1_8878 [Trichoderma aggressivum f. europaeum]
MAPHSTDESPREANTNTPAPPNGQERDVINLAYWESIPGMAEFQGGTVLRVMREMASQRVRFRIRAQALGIMEQNHHEPDAVEAAGPSPVEQPSARRSPQLNQHSGQNLVNGVNGHSDEGHEAGQDEHLDEEDRDASDQPLEQLNINGVHEELDENDGHEQPDTEEVDHHRA